MAQQNNFSFNNPLFSQGSQETYFPGTASSQARLHAQQAQQGQQGQPGSSAMNRHPSTQSNNSSWTDTSTDTFATINWELIHPEEYLQEFKPEPGMASYNYTDGGYEDNFSPVTEQANSLEGMHLSHYQQPSGHISSGDHQADILSSIPRGYPQSFEEGSLSPVIPSPYGMNYRTQPTPSMSRSNSNNDPASLYPPATYLSSNTQNGYTDDQPEVTHTPSSLNWPPQYEVVVEKYKLILPESNKDNSYLEIINKSDISDETPAKVYLGTPASSEKGSVLCPYPGPCTRVEPFTRPADRERHLKIVHGGAPGSFPCSYDPCANDRHLPERAFTRKDHCRDHYRDYHNEDIGHAKRKKEARSKDEKKVWDKAQNKWLEGRRISPNHWRCPRCLVKKWVSKHGWHCGSCNLRCEDDRIQARLALPPTATTLKEDIDVDLDVEVDRNVAVGGMLQLQQQPQQHLQLQFDPYQQQKCGACYEGTGWIDNGLGEWDPCSACSFHETQIGGHAFQN